MEGIPGKEKTQHGQSGPMAVLLARQEAQAKGLLVQRSGQCTGDCAGHCPDRGRNRRAAACGKVGYAFAADRSCGGARFVSDTADGIPDTADRIPDAADGIPDAAAREK